MVLMYSFLQCRHLHTPHESPKKAFYCLNVQVTSKFPDSGLLIHENIDFEKGSTVVKRQLQFITA